MTRLKWRHIDKILKHVTVLGREGIIFEHLTIENSFRDCKFHYRTKDGEFEVNYWKVNGKIKENFSDITTSGKFYGNKGGFESTLIRAKRKGHFTPTTKNTYTTGKVLFRVRELYMRLSECMLEMHRSKSNEINTALDNAFSEVLKYIEEIRYFRAIIYGYYIYAAETWVLGDHTHQENVEIIKRMLDTVELYFKECDHVSKDLDRDKYPIAALCEGIPNIDHAEIEDLISKW